MSIYPTLVGVTVRCPGGSRGVSSAEVGQCYSVAFDAATLFTTMQTSTNANKDPGGRVMSTNNSTRVYVGTYTETLGHVQGKAEGIYVYDLDPTDRGAAANQRGDRCVESIVSNSRSDATLFVCSERKQGG